MLATSNSFNGCLTFDAAGGYPVQTSFFAQILRWNDRPGKRF